MKNYTELIQLPTFEERFQYLRMKSSIGQSTFGGYRFLNQEFYRSREWRALRQRIIVRDSGCDLAHPDYLLDSEITVHHIIPISPDDIINGDYHLLLDPENLILTCDRTHKMIHYGGDSPYSQIVERHPYDTCPWRL